MSTKMVPLRRIAHLVNGGTPTADEANWGGDVQWATPVDLARFDGSIIDITDRTLTRDGLRSGSNCVRVGSIILSTRAPIGYVVQTIGSMAFNQGCKGLELCPDIEPRYVRYWLWAHREVLQGMGSGSTFMELSSDQLLAFEIPDIAPTGQRRIADFLDDQVARIDNIIAARKAQTELLTSVVLATADEAISTASTKAVALRRVISKWIDYRGATPAKTDSGVRLITAGNIRGGLVDLSAADEYIGYDDYSEWMRRGLPRVGDILLTTEAPLGQVAQIVDTSIALAQRIILLRPNYDLLNGDWLYWYLRSPQGQRELFSRATGSTAQGIKAQRLYGIPIWIPPLSVQESLARRIRSSALNAEACLESIQSTIERLVELKRSLITAAVSGEFDVSSADGSQIRLGTTTDVPAGTPAQPAGVAV